MKVNGQHFRTIWIDKNDKKSVQIIDQRKLPFSFEIETIRSLDEMAVAIKDMHLRGAGLIGAAAAYGMYLAVLETQDKIDFLDSINYSASLLKSTRPTAVNLSWAVDLMMSALAETAGADFKTKAEKALKLAESIANQDAEACRLIGESGLPLIRKIFRQKQKKTVHILTHCNAGWLAFVDFGSALAPVYAAFNEKIDIHVWVDETRPRNQGARLTSWELSQQGIKHTVIPDNTGGYLMQKGMVDMVIVGADRVTRNGDVANKIGTYLKALAAHDNSVPFYVAFPSSTIDWEICDGLNEIQIEERNSKEISHIEGIYNGQEIEAIIIPESNVGSNYGFDVTPSRLITGFITERGICEANAECLLNLFPEYEW